MLTYNNFILEYKNEDKNLIKNLNDYFTIGFEIELEPSNIRESWPLYPSRSNKLKSEKIRSVFSKFFNKYSKCISLHYDETIPNGIEIVNSISDIKKYPSTTPSPFKSLELSIQFVKDFFNDYNKQKNWIFTNKTSFQINIGTSEEKNWNITKGVIMFSDDDSSYTLKKIENRRLSEYCSSIKNEILKNKYLIKELNKTNDIKEIENILSITIKSLFKEKTQERRNPNKQFGFNLSNLIFSENKYIEFRHVGGSNINEELIIDKLRYFCYIIYLMTSDYRNKEYIRKLFSFKNKLK